ncbi:MAG: TraB/GumN family protein [Bauldia sp.]|nr:TraB/GumN family protein [Bauldia sp.]
MRSRLKRILLALGILGGLATSAAGEPALLVARDADTTVYLFGTIHYVPCAAADLETEFGLRVGGEATAATGCADWMSDAVQAALGEADELWIETLDVVDGAVDPAMVVEFMMFDGRERLTDYVPEAELRAIAEAIAGPLSEDALAELDTLKPWVVTSLFAEVLLVRGAASATAGVDLTLVQLAEEQGTPLRGFETAEDQIRAQASIPLEMQVGDLRSLGVFARRGIDAAPIVMWMFGKIWAAWLEGDLETAGFLAMADDEAFLERYAAELEALLGIGAAELVAMTAEMNAGYVGLDPAQRAIVEYEAMIAQRNRNWMPAIRSMLNRPGTYFVAVGAAHLTGDGAIQALLAAEGVTVERVQ